MACQSGSFHQVEARWLWSRWRNRETGCRRDQRLVLSVAEADEAVTVWQQAEPGWPARLVPRVLGWPDAGVTGDIALSGLTALLTWRAHGRR
jgi:hypothetical protein